ncbi:GNAT family N-acetyltransferase [Thermodesulfobacteriota bacterium]
MTSSYQGSIVRQTRSIRSFSVTELNDCEKLWKDYLRAECVSDLWEFRLCFHKHFNNKPYFLVLEDRQGIAGILPLAYINETDTAVFFPGEMWEGKTWLERTPIYLRDSNLFNDLLEICPEKYFLRYLVMRHDSPPVEITQDEIGYVLYPKDLNYDFTTYRQRFSNKKFKAIMKVIDSFKRMGCVFHHNRMADFDILIEMSLHKYGDRSFMADHRFREGFRDVMKFLYQQKILRMVSVEINGRIAAIDLGALYNSTYTVFLGGSNPDFPGIAKLINMYHITTSINERFHKIDFLCGDFHWKGLWHLDAEPLYKYVSPLMIAEAAEIESQTSISQTISCPATLSMNP